MANISTTDLPSPTSTYTKTTQTVEEYTLKSGRIYKIEAWGAKGGNGGYGGSSGGNGSHAVGWYDMRTSDNVTAKIFTGGSGGTNGAGWGATAVATQLQGTPGGSSGGGGGGASGIYIGTTALLIAGGGGGGGGYYIGGFGGGMNGGNGSNSVHCNGGKGATQSAHGIGGSGYTGEGYIDSTKNGSSGTANGGGNGGSIKGGGGGAGGGYTRGFAGGGGGYSRVVYDDATEYNGGGGGGSGGSSYIGGVQSLADTPGKATTTWAHTNANGNGKVIITEYIVSTTVASPSNGTEYTVSEPSKTSVLFGESYTFTVTREIGVGDVGLQLNSSNGVLELTSTNGNVFTYTVSNVQGAITSANFSTTSYDVAKPPDDTGCTISGLTDTSVLKGGSYSFTITFTSGYAHAFVKLNTPNGKVNYSGIDMNTLTITISNVHGIILATDFAVTVMKV